MNYILYFKADEPISRVAKLMKEEVLKVQPEYAELLVPQCEDMMYCPEKHTCGRYPSKKELKTIIKNGKNVE